MDAAKGRKMFYVFGEAETNPKEAPVIFWMNG
jgi:carboxypeptidase C (cathepsin A)